MFEFDLNEGRPLGFGKDLCGKIWETGVKRKR